MKNYVIDKQSILKSKMPANDVFSYGIYFLLKKDCIVYVGKTSCGLNRVRAHLKYKDFDSFAFIPWPKETLSKVEADNIYAYKPKYNKHISGDYGYNRKNNIFFTKDFCLEAKKKNGLNKRNITNKKKKAIILQTGEKFDSLTELAKKLDVTISAISHSIERGLYCRGYAIKIIEDDKD